MTIQPKLIALWSSRSGPEEANAALIDFLKQNDSAEC